MDVWMSSLSFADKQQLEKVLDMSSWYILDFSDRTFWEFVFDYTSRNIHDSVYQTNWSSKAKKLRTFWEIESDIVVCNLLKWFVEYIEKEEHKRKITTIVDKLSSWWLQLHDSIEAIQWKSEVFVLLKWEILRQLHEEKYIESLDRIHTLFQAYLQSICNERDIWYKKNEIINGLLWKIKRNMIENNQMIVWSFAEWLFWKIIQILEQYNHVRNNWSLAHTNNLLSYQDAKLTVNIISALLSYINNTTK